MSSVWCAQWNTVLKYENELGWLKISWHLFFSPWSLLKLWGSFNCAPAAFDYWGRRISQRFPWKLHGISDRPGKRFCRSKQSRTTKLRNEMQSGIKKYTISHIWAFHKSRIRQLSHSDYWFFMPFLFHVSPRASAGNYPGTLNTVVKTLPAGLLLFV